MVAKIKRQLLIGGSVVALIGVAVLIFRHLTRNYSNVSTLINSAMGNYFTISELCYSDTAKAKGIDNTPNTSQQANIALLIKHLLNPIREAYGKPIRISSGFRTKALNTLIGGVPNSQHLTGQAADLVPTAGGSLANIFRSAIKVGNFDQLILETNAQGTSWVHVSYNGTSNRHQILRYLGGTYTDISNSWQNYV